MRRKTNVIFFLISLFVLIGATHNYAQTVWSENFSYSDGTTQGSGAPPKWTRNISDCSFDGDDHFEVRNNVMQGNDLDGEAVWLSETIDISSYASVNLFADVAEVGTSESADYIDLYYKIDGGAETIFSVNGNNVGEFTAVTASQFGLSGTTVQIIIKVKNNANTEFHQIENVRVVEAGPEISIEGNNNEIPDGDDTPSTDDFTDFDLVNLGDNLEHEFVILNVGSGSIDLTGSPIIDISGENPGDFNVSQLPVSPIGAGSQTTFSITFSPTALGTRTAIVSISNSDSDENPYDFKIEGSGTSVPDIEVRGNGITIPDGDNTPIQADNTEYGIVNLGSYLDHTFHIHNTGAAELNLTGSSLIRIFGAQSSDFSVVSWPTTPIPGFGSTSFTVRFTPGAAGNRYTTIYIYNDSDVATEQTYTYRIQGTGSTAPPPTLSINDVTENEDVGTMRFAVTLSSPSGLPVSVKYQTSDGTAVSTDDYTSTSGTLDIPPGNTSGNIDVSITGDLIFESDEIFYVNLSDPNNVSIQDEQGVGTILNDDPGSTTLSAEKTADAAFERTWAWSIDKSVYPETWDLFRGDAGISKFTVSVTRLSSSDLITVSGQICVTNTGDLEDTENLTIVDQVQYRTPGMSSWANVPGAMQTITPDAQLSPQEESCYNYSITFEAIDDAEYQNFATVTITNYQGYVSTPHGPQIAEAFTVPAQPASEVNGTIHVQDSDNRSWETSESAEWSYSVTYTCDADAGSHDNTAMIVETQQSDDASVTVNCHELVVTKTAETSYNRYYAWTIDKSADKSVVNLRGCDEETVNYAVRVENTFEDRDHAVEGSIMVMNPAPIDAVINGIEDLPPDASDLNVVCSVTFPHTLAPQQSVTCEYSAGLPDDAQRTNTAKAKLQNYSYAKAPGEPVSKTSIGETDFEGGKTVMFGDTPTDEIDECVNLKDTNQPRLLGTVCAADAPKTFEYPYTVGPYYATGDYAIDNTATYLANDTQAEGSDSWHVDIHVECPAPVAEFSAGPVSGISPLEVNFRDMSVNAARWLWDFGDGNSSTEQHPVHIYNNPPHKYYTVTLTVWDCCDENSHSVTKIDLIKVVEAAYCNFNAVPIVGKSGLEVQFENNCGGLVNHFQWIYGDGSTELLRHNVMAMQHPAHRYTEEGSYTVSLKAWGQGGKDMLTVTDMIYVDDDYQTLEFVEGSPVVDEQHGWGNVIDHDILGPDASAMAYNDSAWALFKLDTTKRVHKVRMSANTATATSFTNHLMEDFELWVSEDGDIYTMATAGSIEGRHGWHIFEFEPVEARYIKLLILNARGQNSPFVTLCEFQAFGAETVIALARVNAFDGTLIDPVIPDDYNLSQNYPNPFNPSTSIRFDLPEQSRLTMTIYNVLGKPVRSLLDAHRGAGRHLISWDGLDDHGQPVSAGLYLCHLRAEGETRVYRRSIKMMMIK
ncbi:MAG: choice-of-anchor D domain-containing protein [candidate division KSB1 bacterium]|jgi:PKD repeat protein|nr:choice-of-anchor D domain-containing protein [candidate division KSB1 bacterium]